MTAAALSREEAGEYIGILTEAGLDVQPLEALNEGADLVGWVIEAWRQEP